MTAEFSITTPTNQVVLVNGTGQAAFTVQNETANIVTARGQLIAESKTQPAWLVLNEPNQRTFNPGQAQTYQAVVSVPDTASAGDYSFYLEMIDVANPDDLIT